MALGPRILHAKIMHKRLRPKVNGFTYGAFYLLIPLSNIASLASSFFGVNRRNVMAFHERDHGARDGSPLLPWIRAILASHGIAEADGEVVLLTLPRVLGHVFNPVSFWFCLDQVGNLRAVLSEVSNTFGEHHGYLSFHSDHRPILPGETLLADKRFHVSPFLAREGGYAFEFAYRKDGVRVRVDHVDGEGAPLLLTSIAGRSVPYTPAALWRAAFRHPLVGLKVVALIHWQAARLFGRGMRYLRKPDPLPDRVTPPSHMTNL